MEAAPKIPVFLVAAHAQERAGLRALLSAAAGIEVIGEAGDGRAAQSQVPQSPARVLVLDLNLPDISGLELTEWLVAQRPEVGVVALASHADRPHMTRLLQAGAKGYVLKAAAAEELGRAIRSVAAGLAHIDAGLTSQLVQEFARHGPHERSVPSAVEMLSARENQVGRLLAQGFSNKQVAARLAISVKTVETHKARLMGKLGLESRVDLVRFAVQAGWLQTLQN